MKVATWNVNSMTARYERVAGWIEANGPDVLCMQETKQDDARFPFDGFRELGYEVAMVKDAAADYSDREDLARFPSAPSA